MAGERILVCSWLVQEDSPQIDWLRGCGYDVIFHYGSTAMRGEEEMIDLLPGVAATLASIEPYSRRVLEAADALRIIARVGVGYDAIDVAAATEHGIAVTTTPGANERAVADFTFTLLLALARELPVNLAAVRAGRWQRAIGVDVAGATIGVIGLGLIGKEVARRARGFGMRILGYDVIQDAAFADEVGLEYRPLEETLAEADFVTMHVPLMTATRGLINAERLAMMKRGAYLINTSRGGTVDEAALAEALTSGHLAGAALDVFGVEPPWGSPLLALPNVLATPHVAGISRGSQEAMATMACRSIHQALTDERPQGLINPSFIEKRRR